MTPILSILMPTIPGRIMESSGLIYTIDHQIGTLPVEFIYLGDNKKVSLATKRNRLLGMAQGDYVCFVDDDDRVANNYVSELVKATEQGSDVIVFQELYSENGGPLKPVYFDIGFECDRNFEDHYERLPHYRMPMRREIVKGFKFPEEGKIAMGAGDDFYYAKAQRPYLKTQTKIDQALYFYDYSPKTSETLR